MDEVWRVARAETRKGASRPLTWALLAILIVTLILHARGLRTSLLDYHQAIETGVGRRGEAVPRQVALAQVSDLRRRMTFPDVMGEVWVVTGSWGIFALLIAASVQTGEEFDIGTGRTMLLRGIGRATWAIAKVLAYLGMAAVAWLLLALIQVPLGLWTQAQAGLTPDIAALLAVDWLGFAGSSLRAWSSTFPYIAMATCLAILARGAGPALAVSLGLRFIESISAVFGPFLVSMKLSGVETFGGLYRVWAPIEVISMGWNAELWTEGRGALWSEAMIMLPGGPPQELPAPFHSDVIIAAGVLLAWGLLWVALAVWSLKHKDVTT
jgi:hypothetical protein